ncbi:lipid-binding SYLF domain-containing protein [Salinisphaera sp. USBA-960]|nr:lipid-binding SYLF domain-containing protein [Salifodinibacter halophilus]NNC27044.1 lipid-binding SYLF domain-containing protein [Salifodinibacter halophilus]
MNKSFWLVVLMAGCLLTGTAVAKPHPSQRANEVIDVLQQFVHIPENAIPPTLLHQAKGIAVIPNVLKIGFVFGGRRGHGVVAVRKPNGKWSKPAMVSLTSASFGLQAGASSTDVILVFKTRQSVKRLAQGQFNLGADASVAAGPVGRHTGASTNLRMKAEIYSYSRSRGLFAGVAIDGGRISIDQDANWLFYDEAGISAADILDNGGSLTMPKAGQRLVYTLNQYLPADNTSGDRGSESDNAAANESDGSSIGKASARQNSGGVSVQRQKSNVTESTSGDADSG